MDISDAVNHEAYISIQPKSNIWEIIDAKIETIPQVAIFSLKYPKILDYRVVYASFAQ